MAQSEEMHLSAKTTSKITDITFKDGYREGFSEGNNDAVQKGFDEGYSLGFNKCFQYAYLRGYLNALILQGENKGDTLTQTEKLLQRLDDTENST